MRLFFFFFFFFSSRRRHTRCLSDWSSDVCSSDLRRPRALARPRPVRRTSPLRTRLWPRRWGSAGRWPRRGLAAPRLRPRAGSRPGAERRRLHHPDRLARWPSSRTRTQASPLTELEESLLRSKIEIDLRRYAERHPHVRAGLVGPVAPRL